MRSELPIDIEAERVRLSVRQALLGEPSRGLAVGRFELRGWLGHGAMGRVYEAYDAQLDRRVALKLLDPDVPEERRSERRARLIREAQALARVRHENVVSVFEVGEAHGQVFLALELVSGAPLDAWCAQMQPSPARALRVLIQAGRGLAAAHASGLVHRDFKPSNVVVSDDDHATVIDFGLVRAVDGASSGDSPLAAPLTRTDVVVGTPAYMSPEQLRAGPVDARTDQFTFAVVVFETVFGSRPFDGRSSAELVAAIMHGEIARPTERRGVPDRLIDVLERALQTDPEKRYEALGALLDELEAVALPPTVARRVADRYLLEAPLGAGGMGIVYRALDEQTGRAVAIKVLDPSNADNEDAIARLRLEARTTAALDHPGVVEIIESGETADGGAFIAMELIDGESLRQRLQRGPLSLDETTELVAHLASALDAAHRSGLVHRDVKPDNIMIREDGRTVLLDLGIAKAISQTDPEGVPVTVEGKVLGTTAYLAPEQARGHPVSPQTDQFALAVTAYEALAGRRPFVGDATAVLAQLVADPAPRLSELAPTIPRSVDAVFERALSKKAEQRFGSVLELAEALRKAKDARASPRLVWWAVAGGVGAICVVALALTGSTSRPEGSSPVTTGTPRRAVELACPMFEVAGASGPSGWLGAAAADLTCREATWSSFGGDAELTRTPAELLDLHPQPSGDYPADPYEETGARERSLTRAREIAQLYTDGRVSHGPAGFEVSLSLRAPGSEVRGRSTGRSRHLRVAVRRALDALESGDALEPAETLAADVALWSPFAELASGRQANETALALAMFENDVDTRCDVLLSAAGSFGAGSPPALVQCEARRGRPGSENRPTEIDRSSPFALAMTAGAATQSAPVLIELASARDAERTRIGRAELAAAEGRLLLAAAENQRARGRFVAAVAEQPRSLMFWGELRRASFGGSLILATVRGATAWAPAFPDNWAMMANYGGPSGGRAEGLRRAFVLSANGGEQGVRYVIQLVADGRVDEAEAVTATLESTIPRDAFAVAVAEAMLLITRGRFRSAIRHLEQALGTVDLFDRSSAFTLHQLALLELRRLGEVTGTRREIADRFAETVIEPAAVEHSVVIPVGMHMTFASLCMHGTQARALSCLSHLRDADPSSASPYGGFEAYLRGATLFVEGDTSGAIEAWRNLLNSGYWARSLPADVFDAAGEHDLAVRCDDADLSRRPYNGISLTLPRQAERAERRGDGEAARALAQEVIDAWVVAEGPVPAVARMRALVARSRP